MLKKAILWVLGIVIALFSGLTTMGAITKSKAPQLAVTLQPLNGFASENLAASSVLTAIAANRGQFGANVDLRAAYLAKQAFISEPITPEAIAVLALGSAEGNRRKLMQEAFALSRRQQLATTWMIADSAAREDIPAILDHYDTILRVKKSARSVVIPVLAQALSDDRFIEPFANLLSRNPPWTNQFWNEVAYQQISILNAAELRLIQKKKFPMRDEINDRLLIANLVTYGYFDAAYALYQALGGEIDDTQAIPRDSLTRPQNFAPFDWKVISKGNYATSINPQSGSLNISAIGGSSGIMARRLVKMTKSPMALSLNVDLLNIEESQLPLRINITCAGPLNPQFKLAIRLKGGLNSLHIPLENSPCEYYWFDIYGSFPDGSVEYNLGIRDISLDTI